MKNLNNSICKDCENLLVQQKKTPLLKHAVTFVKCLISGEVFSGPISVVIEECNHKSKKDEKPRS